MFIPNNVRPRSVLFGLLTSFWSIPCGGATKNFAIRPHIVAPHGAISTIAFFSAVTQRPLIGAAAKSAVAPMAVMPNADAEMIVPINFINCVLLRESRDVLFAAT